MVLQNRSKADSSPTYNYCLLEALWRSGGKTIRMFSGVARNGQCKCNHKRHYGICHSKQRRGHWRGYTSQVSVLAQEMVVKWSNGLTLPRKFIHCLCRCIQHTAWCNAMFFFQFTMYCSGGLWPLKADICRQIMWSRTFQQSALLCEWVCRCTVGTQWDNFMFLPEPAVPAPSAICPASLQSCLFFLKL